MVLTVMSYILPQRKDLIGNFERTISTNVQYFLMDRSTDKQDMDDYQRAKSVVLKSRFSLLLGYYADILFV